MKEKSTKGEKANRLVEKGENNFKEARYSPADEVKERVDMKLKEKFEKERNIKIMDWYKNDIIMSFFAIRTLK